MSLKILHACALKRQTVNKTTLVNKVTIVFRNYCLGNKNDHKLCPETDQKLVQTIKYSNFEFYTFCRKHFCRVLHCVYISVNFICSVCLLPVAGDK